MKNYPSTSRHLQLTFACWDLSLLRPNAVGFACLRGRHSDVSSRVVVACCCCCCCAAEARCPAWKKTAVSATNKMCGMCIRLSAAHIECKARVEKKWAHSPPGIQHPTLIYPASIAKWFIEWNISRWLRGIIHAASLALCPTLLLLI